MRGAPEPNWQQLVAKLPWGRETRSDVPDQAGPAADSQPKFGQQVAALITPDMIRTCVEGGQGRSDKNG